MVLRAGQPNGPHLMAFAASSLGLSGAYLAALTFVATLFLLR